MTKPKIDRSRHFFKTITWRIIGTLDTMLLGWLVSGDHKVGLTIGSLELVTKMALYYGHERVWYSIDYGVKRRQK